MSGRLGRFAVGAALLLVSSAVSAQVTVTGPATGSNCFPFGCAPGTSTRYQQVYSAAAFGGPISIGEISFFLGSAPADPGDLNGMTFDLYLSTTSAAVDGLSTTFDSNLGAPTSLFGSYTIGGVAPSTLTFSGASYLYDPGAGNLLIDIRVSSVSAASDPSFFVARNNAPGGNYSRVQNYGSGQAGYGLDTRFATGAAVVPEPATVALLGGGLLALGAVARRRRAS